MSHWNAKHWTVLVALIGVVALHLMAAEHWADVYGNPKAVGELVLQIGTTLGALFLRKPGDHEEIAELQIANSDLLQEQAKK